MTLAELMLVAVSSSHGSRSKSTSPVVERVLTGTVGGMADERVRLSRAPDFFGADERAALLPACLRARRSLRCDAAECGGGTAAAAVAGTAAGTVTEVFIGARLATLRTSSKSRARSSPPAN